jgi:hypothetical protein
MDKFSIYNAPAGGKCFVVIEGTPLRVELSEPADYQHAWRVANFLAENVKGILAESRPEAREDRSRSLAPDGKGA